MIVIVSQLAIRMVRETSVIADRSLMEDLQPSDEAVAEGFRWEDFCC